MAKSKNRKNSVSIEKYKAAFCKCVHCKEEDFLIKPLREDGPMMANFEDEVYQIDSYQDLKNYADEMLTSDGALHLPIYIWLDIAEDIHLQEEFIIKLVESFDSVDEYERLNLALSLSRNAGNNCSVFWRCIYKLDRDDLYPKAIVAATKTYDFESIKEELIEGLIEYGEQILCQIQGGTFESINLNEDEDSDESQDQDQFYIYSIAPEYWTDDTKTSQL